MFDSGTLLSISDVNNYIKNVLTNDESLKFIHIKGEISNFKVYPSGHIYFSLKDSKSVIQAVMFANYTSKLTFAPNNGDEVTVLASIDVYPPRGNYQLMVYEMELFGQGAMLLELEKLKKKLAAEGLFDESRKRDIDIFPKAIGVITAKNGAAVKDIVTNIKLRYPLTDIYVFPSTVQGENAPKELLKAFELSQTYDLTTLIIGRGGGASEDLGAFNDEKLVRAIANSKCPVISAVGHEVDTTLVDFVADKRASTPTGAAVLATVDLREIQNKFILAKDKLDAALEDKVSDAKEDLKEYLKDIKEALTYKLDEYKTDLAYKKKHLESINPKALLSRGYAYVQTSEGKIIDDINKINVGDRINVTLNNGTLISEVKEKK